MAGVKLNKKAYRKHRMALWQVKEDKRWEMVSTIKPHVMKEDKKVTINNPADRFKYLQDEIKENFDEAVVAIIFKIDALEGSDGRSVEKIGCALWCPETIPTKAKVTYATYLSTLKTTIDVTKHFLVDQLGDITYADFLDNLHVVGKDLKPVTRPEV